jgi:L-2,4-diaminobutyric acid acetyltransferase
MKRGGAHEAPPGRGERMNVRPEQDGIVLRHPQLADSPELWQLVKAVGTLDLNSSYAYVLMCRHFAHTCVLAELDGRTVGFVTGYLPPEEPGVLFVWQVGVAEAARGRGLAGRMLDWLLRADACAEVEHLETTVSPTNEASRALFASLAGRWSAQLSPIGVFPAGLFPEAGHEPEPLLRIGPLVR